MAALDTHESYKRLVEAGVPERQAEEHVRLYADRVKTELVTRDYLDQRLMELEYRLTLRMIAIVGVGVAILAALMTALKLFA